MAEKEPQWEALENIREAHQIKIAVEATVVMVFTDLVVEAEAAETVDQDLVQTAEAAADLVLVGPQLLQMVLMQQLVQAEAAEVAKKVQHLELALKALA
jgi:cellobiose-specific phosphotransferase system component IIB